MSSAGRQYRAANGSRIRNHGQVPARFVSSEGHSCEMVFQIADVERILIGATPLTRMGNEFHLREEDGDIVHAETGRRIHLLRKGGVYVMLMHFLVDAEPEPESAAAGFARLGA